MSFSRRGITEGQNKKRKLSLMKKEIKRISLMTAIFLTVTLVSSAVEAGVIRINGIIAGSESDTPFPDPAEGFYANGSVTSTDTELGPFTMFYSAPLAFAFLGMPPGDIAGIRLIVGDAANGDSILTWGLANRGNPDSCANGDIHLVGTNTIVGGTHCWRNGPVRWC
jgi:hypothetical protein